MEKQVLTINNNPTTTLQLNIALQQSGFHVFNALDSQHFFDQAKHNQFWTLILSLDLIPDDGLTLINNLRAAQVDTPIIVLDSDTKLATKLATFDAGADDFIVEPASLEEVVAHVNSIGERYARVVKELTASRKSESVSKNDVLTFGPVKIDQTRHLVFVTDLVVRVTPKEYKLLKLLVKHHGIVLSREKILNEIWGYNYFGESRIVDIHISHLRDKLGKDVAIKTIRGFGYSLEFSIN